MRTSANWVRTGAGVLLVGLVAVGLVGCERPTPSHAYTVLAGTVLSCNPEAGELTLELRDQPARKWSGRVPCVLTKDSEVYVNDRFSSLAEIQVGNAVEVIGYREANRRLETFVVAYAYVEQPGPPVKTPPLLLPRPEETSQPRPS